MENKAKVDKVMEILAGMSVKEAQELVMEVYKEIANRTKVG